MGALLDYTSESVNDKNEFIASARVLVASSVPMSIHGPYRCKTPRQYDATDHSVTLLKRRAFRRQRTVIACVAAKRVQKEKFLFILHTGFVRSWKTWKSHGILKWSFPGLEKSWKKLKS